MAALHDIPMDMSFSDEPFEQRPRPLLAWLHIRFETSSFNAIPKLDGCG